MNARFTSEEANYEEWYYITVGKNQTGQQAKRLKAKRMLLKKILLTLIVWGFFYCTMMVPTIPPCSEQI